MTYISNSMQSFMPIDLRASQFVRGSTNFLAKNTTTSLGVDKNISFRKYNADVKELTALSGSMDKLTAVFESHRAELGDIEDKLNRVKDIVNTVKTADDAYADYTADPVNNPVATPLAQQARDDYQREINTLLGDIETKVANTKVNGTSLFGGYFKANMIGDNKSEAFAANFQHGYVSADGAGNFTASANVSSSGKLGRDFSIDGNYMVASALNQGNSGNGVYSASNAGQGAAFLFNMNTPSTTQQIYNLPGSVPSSGANSTFYREKFGLVHDFGSSVELDHTQNLVAIGMADNVDPTYSIGNTILDSNGNARTYATDTRVFNANGTYKKTNINYVMGQNIYDAQGEKTYYSSVTKAFNSDGSYKMQSIGTYAVGDTIKDSNGNNTVYTSTDDLRMFNADGTQKIISLGTYGVGDNIKDLNGNDVTYTATDDRRMFNTDGSQKVVSLGTYAVGDNITDLNGNNVTYTATDDLRMFNTDGTQKVVSLGTYAVGDNIKDLNGNNVTYTATDDRRMFNTDGSQKVVSLGTYAVGDNIKDLNGNNITYTATDDRRMFNTDGSQKVVSLGTYAVGDSIKDLNGNNVTYTATDDRRMFNTDGSQKVVSLGTYAVGDNIKDLNGNDVTYTATDDRRMFNTDGSQKVVSLGTYAVGDNIKDLNGNNVTYTATDDRRVFNTNGTWDGTSYHAVGTTKKVQIDSALLITGSAGDLAGATKSGTSRDGYGSFAVGATKTIQLDSSASTSSAGYIATGIKAGASRDGYGSFAVGDVKTIQLNSSASTSSAGYIATGIKAGASRDVYGTFAVGATKTIQLNSSASTSSAGYIATGLKAGSSRDGYGTFAVGTTKTIQLDSSASTSSVGYIATGLKAGSSRDGYGSFVVGDLKKIQLNSSASTSSAGYIATGLKAGVSRDGYGTFAVGTTKTIQLNSSASTSSVGYIATGIKAGASRDGYGSFAVGDVKKIQIDGASLIAGSVGDLSLQTANTNYQTALKINGANPNFLAGIKKAGDSVDVHVTHAAGTEQKIELASSAATNTVGWASSGRKVGQAAIRQEYNLAGSTMKIEMGADAQLVAGSPGELLARESNRLNVNFLPNAGDRKMINADNSVQEHGGAVYLFEENTSNFIREFKPAGLKDGDKFGSEIVIEGDKIFIGAAGDDAGGTNAGAVYVYNVNNGNLITKINGSTANAAVGSDGSIVASDGQVAIGRLAGTAGKTKVDIFNVNNMTSPIRSLQGAAAGDNFGYSMKMKKNTGTGVNELLISSSNANTGDGSMAIYDTNTGSIVVDANGQEAKISGNFVGSNPAIGSLGVDFNDTYMSAKGSDGLIYTYNRDDKALKKVNTTNVSQQKFEVVGNMLHLGEYGNGNKVGVYDITSNPTIEGLNMDITLRDVANGLSATLSESVANLSISDQVATILGTTGDNDADGADKNTMDVVLRNFQTMKQNYEDTISKLKKQSNSLIDKKDMLTNIQKFDEANVKETLNKVYGSKPVNLSTIMQPFDKNIVSSLLP
jgi:hypothetical protein